MMMMMYIYISYISYIYIYHIYHIYIYHIYHIYSIYLLKVSPSRCAKPDSVLIRFPSPAPGQSGVVTCSTKPVPSSPHAMTPDPPGEPMEDMDR